MTYIALYAPTQLQMSSVRPTDQPLAGAELSLLRLRHALEKLGHSVVCFTNFNETSADASLRKISDFQEQEFELVIYSRTYSLKLRTNNLHTRRILWLHETVEEAASLLAGGIKALGEALRQYHHLVFVSAWQRGQYSLHFPRETDWRKATSIRHLLPQLSLKRSDSIIFDVIHTAHPRKALAAVLDIYDFLVSKRPSIRLALVNAAVIYQEIDFPYKGRHTNLHSVLEARYGKNGPPFAVIPAMAQHELIALLTQSQVFLHPDESTETGATTLLEAIQAGCATVVSDLGCMPEMASATGSVLPAPGKVPVKAYAEAIFSALDRPTKFISCDVGQNISYHNAVQISRWVLSLEATFGTLTKSHFTTTSNFTDINGILAEHPQKHILELAIPGLPKCKLAVHILPQRGIALLGILEPTILPDIKGDVDEITSTLHKAIGKLLVRLKEHSIYHLIMRIAYKPNSSAMQAAWLCAAAMYGARITTIRQLSMAFQAHQDDEHRERTTFSPRVREQVIAARKVWEIRRVFGNSSDFDVWFSFYENHRRSYGAIGLARERVRKMFDSDGELSVHGALAINPNCGEPCGFYLIIRVGDFATLHSWGTNRRYRSNLHKLLIADAAQLAGKHKVKNFEYGSDLSEHGLHQGLNSLYRHFGGTSLPGLQLDLPIITGLAQYALT